MASMSNDSVPRVAELDVQNYVQWSTESEHIMRFKGCWQAVDRAGQAALAPFSPGAGAAGTIAQPTPEVAAATVPGTLGGTAEASAAALKKTK